MKYCEKCNHITNDSTHTCPVCNNKTLKSGNPQGSFPVVVVRASGFEKNRICAVLDDENIPHSERIAKKQFSSDAVTGSSMADYDIMVPYDFYSKTFDLLVGINALNPDEEELNENAKIASRSVKSDFDGEDYFSTKNRIIRIVSVILLMALVAGVVLGVDAIMALIKGLF